MNCPARSVAQRSAPRERGFFLPLLALCFGVGIWLAPRVSVGLWPLWLVALAALLALPLALFRLPMRWLCLPLALAVALLWTHGTGAVQNLPLAGRASFRRVFAPFQPRFRVAAEHVPRHRVAGSGAQRTKNDGAVRGGNAGLLNRGKYVPYAKKSVTRAGSL